MGTMALIPRVKQLRCEADHLSPSGTEFKTGGAT